MSRGEPGLATIEKTLGTLLCFCRRDWESQLGEELSFPRGIMNRDKQELIIDFYRNEYPDHKGRTLSQILQKSDRWLEETHDYIQWLFPLEARSEFNPHAPVLTDHVRKAFASIAHPDHATLQQNFSRSIYRMLVFYGYSFSPLAPDTVSPTGEWHEKARNWLTAGNHNFMRITRMLRSMSLLGRMELAQSFHSALVAAARVHPDIISSRTLSFWADAIPHS
jgi:Opioid growth factor receptor (OGFr) conserved region